MYPAYRYADPYHQPFPLQTEQNQYPLHYLPNVEPTSPNVRAASEPWPQNISFRHPNPTEPHTCCNQSYPSGYYSFRPPYSQMQPPPQMYYHGPYPHPDQYPIYYAPPPHYSTDHTGYVPGMAKYHCCGCPNHNCNPSSSTVRIEEQPHEPEPRNKDSSSLIQSPNSPHPVIWIPPGYLKGDNSSGSWVPLDVNTLKGMRQGGEEKNRTQGDNEKVQFPWPVMWMPGKDMKEIGTGAKSLEELPLKLKSAPLKLLEDGNNRQKTDMEEVAAATKARPESVSHNKSKIRTIPVIPAEKVSEMKPATTEKYKEKGDEHNKIVPEKHDDALKRASECKQAQAKKTSKLPPVCLRVDPLRKKSTSGASHSSASHLNKEDKALQKDKSLVPETQERNEPSKKGIHVVDINGKSSENVSVSVVSSKNVSGATAEPSSGKGVEKNAGTEKKGNFDISRSEEMEEIKGRQRELTELEAESSEHVVRPVISSKNVSGTTAEASSGKGAEKNDEIEKIGNADISRSEEGEAIKKRRRELTEIEAALIIQSACRGWEVRRLKPLEKLRKIARVCEQLANVKAQIEDLEANPTHTMKQRVFVSETIMNLLLQLDTVQGLHPSVRERRKSVARDLVSLQEKLDCLGSRTSEEFDATNVNKDGLENTPNTEPFCAVKSTPATEPVPQNGPSVEFTADDGISHLASAVEETESDQRDKYVIPVDVEVQEETGEPRSVKKENHDFEVVTGEPNTVEDIKLPSCNASVDSAYQELSEPEVTSLIPTAIEVDACDAKDGVEQAKPPAVLINPEEESVTEKVDEPEHRPEADELLKYSSAEADTEKPSVQVINVDEAADVLTAEEPEHLIERREEQVRNLIEDGDTKQEQLQLLPSMEEGGQIESVSAESFGNTTDVSSSVQEEEDYPEGKVKLHGEAVSEATIDSSPEAPFETIHVVDEAMKSVGDTALPVLQETADHPEGKVELHGEAVSEANIDSSPEAPFETIHVVDEAMKSAGDTALPVLQEIADYPEGKLELHGEAVSEANIDSSPEAPFETIYVVDEAMKSAGDTALPVLQEIADYPDGKVELHGEVVSEANTDSSPEAPFETIHVVDEDMKSVGDTTLPVLQEIADHPEDKDTIGASAAELHAEGHNLADENEKLRVMLGNLIEAGNQQLRVISDLNARVKDLEKKTLHKKRVKVRRSRLGKASPQS